MIKEETHCRLCGGDLVSVLDLGKIYPSAFVKDTDELPEKAPLVLAKCEACNLIQLKHTVNLDQMYRQYWYTSSLNKSMVSSLQAIAEHATHLKSLNKGDVVIDIGCNDGTLFKFFPDNCYKIGFDPALNLEEEATKNCDLFINDYFHSDLLPYRLHKKAKIITSIAMFYDLPDPHDFIASINNVLADDGIWVIQFTDLISMLKATAFDNICHEHLEYYTLDNLNTLMRAHDLEIFNVEYNMVNGGSLRVFVQKIGKVFDLHHHVEFALQDEINYLTSFRNPFEVFAHKIKIQETIVKSWLKSSKEKGLKTYVLGASTKGNTLLQVWGLTHEDFPYALEVNSDKFGLNTVGSHINIIPEDEGLALKPDQLFILPWHFVNNIKNNLQEYLEEGGKLVTPLPNFSIYYKENDYQWVLEQKVLVS